MFSLPFILALSLGLSLQLILIFILVIRQSRNKKHDLDHYEKLQSALTTQIHQLHVDLQQINQSGLHTIHDKLTQSQLTNQQIITETMQRQMTDVREQMSHSFKQHAGSLTSHLQTLTEEIRNHLHSLTQQVSNRLTEGFEKTSSTFTEGIKSLREPL